MNKTIFVLSIFLIVLIYKVMLGDTNYNNYKKLKNEVKVIIKENKKYSEEINVLKSEIINFKKNSRFVIEEKARNELGLTKEKETFYQILK